MPNPTTVLVISGSTRFIEEMRELESKLTWLGYLVFAPTKCDLKAPNPLWDDPVELKAGAERLAKVHYAAMCRASRMIVYGDYVGESVREEIRFAKSIGLPIWFTNEKFAEEFGGNVYSIP